MQETRRAFSIDVKVGESVTIDRGRVRVLVTVLEKSGKTAKLGFEAPAGVPINKVTLYPSGATQAKNGIGSN
jgi:sRNA-binding carbon storage regulator CsrA